MNKENGVRRKEKCDTKYVLTQAYIISFESTTYDKKEETDSERNEFTTIYEYSKVLRQFTHKQDFTALDKTT